MSGLRGIAAGVLGLTMLQAIVGTDAGTKNAGGVITFVSKGLARWFNPYTPLIPDLRKPASTPASTPAPPNTAGGGGSGQIIVPPSARPTIPAGGWPGTPSAPAPGTTTPRSTTTPRAV